MTMNARCFRIGVMIVLVAAGLPGRAWTTTMDDRFVRLSELKQQPISLTDDSSSGRGYAIAGREFSSQQTLLAFLESQPAVFFANGILLVDDEKAVRESEILRSLTELARRKRFNLYLRQAVGKRDDEQRVRWIVEAR